MIAFWVNTSGLHGIQGYRDGRGRQIAGVFHPKTYEAVSPELRLSTGTQIFASLDQLHGPQTQLVRALWDAHAAVAPEARRLNDPRRALGRFELLEALYREGLNRFRAYGIDELPRITSYPVFVRHRYRHGGPVSSLLEHRSDVAEAIRAFRARGYRRRDLMITEFCDTSDRSGVFRKYSAYRVGNRILACHVMAARAWNVHSSDNAPDAEQVREEVSFVAGNPHGDWLRRVFEIARIDYGRVDYGVTNGQPQVWEINTNPTLGRGSGDKRLGLPPDLAALKEEGRRHFHAQLRDAFLAIDTNTSTWADVRLDRRLVAAARAEAASQRRRLALVRALRQIFEKPLARPARALFATFFRER